MKKISFFCDSCHANAEIDCQQIKPGVFDSQDTYWLLVTHKNLLPKNNDNWQENHVAISITDVLPPPQDYGYVAHHKLNISDI